jgi:RND family efflux transporter MFP subunit
MERPAEQARGRRGPSAPWIVAGLSLATLIGYIVVSRSGKGDAQTAKPGNSDLAPAPSKTTVTLTDSKYREAKIAIEPARIDRLATEVGVAGAIQVNADRQVEIRPRASGFVSDVKVGQGKSVKKGDLLVTLDSPEVGTARLNLRARQRELSTARFEATWKSEIAANVALLIPELRNGINQRRGAIADDDDHAETRAHDPGAWNNKTPANPSDARAIEKRFADKLLGTYRGTLLQAYAEFDIASHEEQKTASLRSQNIVGEHPALVARHTREGIQAKLESAIEQVRFDAAQEKRMADQTVRLAESAVIDAAQRLRILGVTEDIPRLLARADDANKVDLEENITYYPIVAPFDGTIVKRSAVISQKADSSDALFTLADLSTVWVTANITESDVAKLPKIKDGTIHFTATAYSKQEFAAQIIAVGAAVDPHTRTLPLVARTNNPGQALVPGMFVHIVLDSNAIEQALTVPSSAVVEIDAEHYVFVPAEKGPGNRTFTRRPVETGRLAGDRWTIKSGLSEGDSVVSSGAYLIKSELVLQNETDEE